MKNLKKYSKELLLKESNMAHLMLRLSEDKQGNFIFIRNTWLEITL